jgi:hypothetical protein
MKVVTDIITASLIGRPVILEAMKVVTEIITESLIGRPVILVIMSATTFKTDVIVFICNMKLTSH